MSNKIYSLQELFSKYWFLALPPEQKELIQQSLHLLEDAVLSKKEFYDYSFIIMPAAKAYEGFIKDLLYFLKLISKKRYQGSRFRVGKALNPDLARHNPEKYEALFDDLKEISGDKKTPQLLWNTWKNCRNKVFHYFSRFEKSISLNSAKNKLAQIFNAIQTAFHVFNYNPKFIYQLDAENKKQ